MEIFLFAASQHNPPHIFKIATTSTMQESADRVTYQPRPVVQMLEDQLQTTSGKALTADVLEQTKIIGLYFSASWCPPCQAFTPVLAQWYEDAKELYDDIEIIYMSYDKSIEEFDEYFSKMPFPALPFEKRSLVKKLFKELNVIGVPILKFLNADGEILEDDGQTLIENADGSVEKVMVELRK